MVAAQVVQRVKNNMLIVEIQREIQKLKKERNVCVLAHSYQSRDIIEVADFVGDSYQLSVEAARAKQKNVIMCGVRFMAETVKIISPEKFVYLANPTAGCPMAEQMDRDLILQLKEKNPDYTVVCYINTTAELKTVCDVCVTSSTAVNIVNKIKNNNILFIPDYNLGKYIAERCLNKNIKLFHGGCPTHAKITTNDVEKARSAHPGALLLVHPECIPDVVKSADFVGSTSAIMEYAQFCSENEYIIGTENSISEHLQFLCSDKRFYPLSKDMICSNMKATTLIDLFDCINNAGGEEIKLDEITIIEARKCIDEMLRLGKI